VHTQQCNRHFPRLNRSHFADCILQMPVAARVNEVNLSLASSLFETFSAVLRTPHRRRLHRGNVGRSSLAQTPSVLLHGSRSLRSQGRYLPHSQDWTLQLRQVLHCDPRLLSVGGGGGFLRWCMAYPALGAILLGSDGAARVFSPSRFQPRHGVLLAPPDSLGESHGQPSEIADSLRCNLGMSGIDRLLVGFLCPIVLSAFLKEHT
jgi:hypothetical protein